MAAVIAVVSAAIPYPALTLHLPPWRELRGALRCRHLCTVYVNLYACIRKSDWLAWTASSTCKRPPLLNIKETQPQTAGAG